jgi:hypothetical protein
MWPLTESEGETIHGPLKLIKSLRKAGEAYSKALGYGLDDVRASHAHWEVAIILMRNESHARALDELGLAEKHANAANSVG